MNLGEIAQDGPIRRFSDRSSQASQGATGTTRITELETFNQRNTNCVTLARAERLRWFTYAPTPLSETATPVSIFHVAANTLLAHEDARIW